MANGRYDQEPESSEETESSSSKSSSSSESESESESASRPEFEQPPKKPPTPAAAAKKIESSPAKSQTRESSSAKSQTRESSSSSSEETESEPDTDSDTRTPNPSTKPMDDPQKSAPKPKSTSVSTGGTSPVKSAAAVVGSKRPVAGDIESNEPKRSKSKPENSETEDVKKQLFQRLWSEDDEIVILKGMIDYATKKKADPVGNLNAFHDFIKKSLHIDVSKTQLQDKIRRLKKKYENNASKEKKGKERTFSKSHEQRAYELSKKIWGKEKTDNASTPVVKVHSNGNAKNEQSKNAAKSDRVLVLDEVEKIVGCSNIANLLSGEVTIANLEEWIEKNSGSVNEDKRNEMQAKRKALEFAQIEQFLKRVELIVEQGKVVLDAMRPRD